MNKVYLLLSFCLLGLLQANSQETRKVILFDNNWKFFRGDVKGAEVTSFNDAAWRSLNVPHDWSIEGTYDRGNATGRGGGYLPCGIGWYRKTFFLDEKENKKQVFIEFDGVMANSEVWINGHYLGKRPNGYVSFQYELSHYLNFGKNKNNVLVVKADNSVQPASRWYTGAGIYRHVHMVIVNPVHVSYNGSFVYASSTSKEKSSLQIQTAVVNEESSLKKVIVKADIISPSGETIAKSSSAQTVAAHHEETILQHVDVIRPALWDIEHPQLYTALISVWIEDKKTDEIRSVFGIRDAHFEAATGFWLNGKNIKLKGVCMHHDGGAVGAAVPLRVYERRLELLKSVGVNAIRTSHNETSPEFLSLCDKMGLLVMDETFDTWTAKKSSAENGYNLYFNDWWEKDTKSIIMRDRNHPSIVIYSIGNEIHDNLNDSSGFRKYRMQQDLVHALDPSRPVTMALFRPALSHVYENGFAQTMDVVGQNYRENELVAAHEKHPEWKVIGTENRHEQAAWMVLRDKPYIAGQFLWTGFDYLGEADWPKIANTSGLFDKTGGARDIAFQRAGWWSDKPVLHVMRKEQNAGAGDWISDWSPTDIDTYDEAKVQAFSNCDEVELFLNGRSVGVRKRPDDNASPRIWSFPFEKGTLKAVARNKGKVVAEQALTTAGKPAKIILTADKASVENKWDDVVYVTATVTDENGEPCLNADNKIKFNCSGAGDVVAVDNADVSSSESYKIKERWAYKGRCIAIVQAKNSSGIITVTAAADQLQTGSVSISVK